MKEKMACLPGGGKSCSEIVILDNTDVVSMVINGSAAANNSSAS